jgi:hypothetical protein
MAKEGKTGKTRALASREDLATADSGWASSCREVNFALVRRLAGSRITGDMEFSERGRASCER